MIVSLLLYFKQKITGGNNNSDIVSKKSFIDKALVISAFSLIERQFLKKTLKIILSFYFFKNLIYQLELFHIIILKF